MVENQGFKNVIFWLMSQEIVSSQEDLAEKLGYNPAYISHILAGTKPLSDKFIGKLVALCDRINPEYFHGQGDMLRADVIQKIDSISGGSVIGRVGGNANIETESQAFKDLISENDQLKEDNRKLLDQVIKLTERIGVLTDRLIEK